MKAAEFTKDLHKKSIENGRGEEGMNILSLLKLLGGLGLFLYCMLTMGNALEKMAGEKLEKT